MAEATTQFWTNFSEFFEIGIAVFFTVVFVIAFSWIEWYRRRRVRKLHTRRRWRIRALVDDLRAQGHCIHELGGCCWDCPKCPKFWTGVRASHSDNPGMQIESVMGRRTGLDYTIAPAAPSPLPHPDPNLVQMGDQYGAINKKATEREKGRMWAKYLFECGTCPTCLAEFKRRGLRPLRGAAS